MNVLPVIWMFDPDFATVILALQWEIVAYSPLLSSLYFIVGVAEHDFHNTAPYSTLTGE